MEKPCGNSNNRDASDAVIGFLNGKERKEWVNFLKFGGIGGTLGGSAEWNFGRTTAQL